MAPEEYTIKDRLLEYHLRECSAQQRRQIEVLLESDPQLAALSEGIGRYLSLLDAYDPEPPADLEEKVLAHVRAADQAVAIEARKAGDVDAGDSPRGLSLFSMRDLIAAAASIAIIVAMFVPIYLKAVDMRRRSGCQANLGRIALGTAMYASDYEGELPYAGFTRGASWLPGGPSTAPHDSNTKHWYLLVKNGYVQGVAFVCPSSGGQPVRRADAGRLNDFPSPEAVRYSLQNMAGPRLPIDQMGAMPIAADLSPYFKNGRFRIDLEWPHNADAHGRNAGQMVANADGSADWRTTPNCGIGGDNIYQAGSRTAYVGTERPEAPTDTFAINF